MEIQNFICLLKSEISPSFFSEILVHFLSKKGNYTLNMEVYHMPKQTDKELGLFFKNARH